MSGLVGSVVSVITERKQVARHHLRSSVKTYQNTVSQEATDIATLIATIWQDPRRY